jgi:transposase, IS5 family
MRGTPRNKQIVVRFPKQDAQGKAVLLRAEGAHWSGTLTEQGHVHSVCTDLLHGEERKVWGDGGYQGQGEAIRQAAPRAQDMTSRRVQYKNFVDELQKAKNRVKARVRAKVEHPFRILKRIFGFEKVRYRGIKKNHHRLCASFALVNLYLHRRRLAVARAWCL